MIPNDLILKYFEEHENVLNKTKMLAPVIEEAAALCAHTLQSGNKILVCGNGGSAADSQHIAAEFVGRYHNERKSLPAIALTTDSSILTAVGNDYDFDRVFSRQVSGLGVSGDLLWAISTSGNSKNVNEALKTARSKGLKTIGFTGHEGGLMKSLCDVAIVVPADVTARIQEMHILCAHIICQIIDDMEW